MKKIVITLFLFFNFTNFVFSQEKSFWFEYQGTISSRTYCFPMNSYSQLVASSFTCQNEKGHGFGFTGFALLSSTWGELYVGPMYNVSFDNDLYFEGGVSLGIETDNFSLRGACYLFLERNNLWSLVNYEYGGSGSWYLGIIEYKFNKKVGLGIQARKFAAHGIRMSLYFKRFSFWSVVGINQAMNSAITFGIRINM